MSTASPTSVIGGGDDRSRAPRRRSVGELVARSRSDATAGSVSGQLGPSSTWQAAPRRAVVDHGADERGRARSSRRGCGASPGRRRRRSRPGRAAAAGRRRARRERDAARGVPAVAVAVPVLRGWRRARPGLPGRPGRRRTRPLVRSGPAVPGGAPQLPGARPLRRRPAAVRGRSARSVPARAVVVGPAPRRVPLLAHRRPPRLCTRSPLVGGRVPCRASSHGPAGARSGRVRGRRGETMRA